MIYIRFPSGAEKTVREHNMAPAGGFGRVYTPLRLPVVPPLVTSHKYKTHHNKLQESCKDEMFLEELKSTYEAFLKCIHYL